MAFKSIIDIDINDEKFKSFLESFQRYSEEAEKAPEDWHRLAESISGAEKRVRGFGSSQNKAFSESGRHVNDASRALRGYSGSAGQANASVTAISTSLGKTNRHQKSFIESVRKGSSGLKNFSVDAAASALGLDELAGPLAGVAIGITAIAAAAAKAALGLDKLTASKAKNAKEMGMTIAQQQAFQNYGSQMFENPDAAAAAMYRAKMNPQDRQPLLAAGMTEQQIESQSVPQALFTYAKDIRAKLKAVPAAERGALWQSYGADKMLGGTGAMGLLLNTHSKHINDYLGEYKKHKHAYDISMKTAHNAVRTSQAASELRSKVTTNLENVAASKPATAASLGVIRGGRAAVNGIDWAATSFASKIEQAGGVLISDAEKAGNAIGTALHKAAGWAEKKAGLVSPIGKAYAKTYGYQDNNPFDLMPGGKLAKFPTQTAGIQAAAQLLRKHYNGQSIAQMAKTYAGAKLGTPQANDWQTSALKHMPMNYNLNTPIDFDKRKLMVDFLQGLRRGENSIPHGVLPIKKAVDTMPYYKGQATRPTPAQQLHPAASTHKQIHDAAKQGIMEGMGNVHIHIHTTGSGQVGKVAVAAHAAGR
ncbi:hypothetical protein HF670_07460 [Acidithiobacillus thiooxidans]|jgi:hypothetical protein|uniref:hypothetical protein n=1 Tax=Acidithiobacillus thiooxidans TaxID=930 RepID=UPI001C0651C4|nr:hypothetical protein [Acidithiobacillus thiooxidans]MBU2839402.1 hypothetical protein [Acidithiobacillus thiooxidans]